MSITTVVQKVESRW